MTLIFAISRATAAPHANASPRPHDKPRSTTDSAGDRIPTLHRALSPLLLTVRSVLDVQPVLYPSPQPARRKKTCRRHAPMKIASGRARVAGPRGEQRLDRPPWREVSREARISIRALDALVPGPSPAHLPHQTDAAPDDERRPSTSGATFYNGFAGQRRAVKSSPAHPEASSEALASVARCQAMPPSLASTMNSVRVLKSCTRDVG